MIMAGAQRNGAVRMMSPGDIVTLDHRVPGSSPDAAHNSPPRDRELMRHEILL